MALKNPHLLRIVSSRTSLAACALILLAASTAPAQETPLVRRPGAERMLNQDVESMEVQSEGEDGGIPFSEVIRDTEPPYEDVARDLTVGGTSFAKIGNQGAARFHADFFRNVRLNTPFAQGIQPENAELKFGNFYLDVASISGAALYSDNIERSEVDEDDGVIAVTRLHVGALYQLSDRLRIGVRGALVYFPLKNRFGVAGFGIDDPFAAFDYFPLAQANFVYDLYAGEWLIQFIDQFRARHQRVGADLDFELFEGETFDEQDEAGRYRYRSPRILARGPGDRDRDTTTGTDLIELRNSVGVIASRMLPTVTRAELGAFHEDIWYTGRDDRGLPNGRDFAYANLVSERESLRFKPFASYRISKYNTQDDWDQRARAGVRGPITDYLFFLGDVGLFHQGDSDRTATLLRLRLEHNPTELIYHQLQYSREVTEPDVDLEERWSYRLRYKINPHLYAELFGIRSHFEDLDRTGTESDETRAGLRFTMNPIRRTTIRLGAVYSQFDFKNPVYADAEIWTARMETIYRYSETLEARLTYQYQVRDSERALDSYDENLVILSVMKFF